MRDIVRTPSIVVTIGRQTRLYHAFVTTAPASLDSPSIVTLYASTLADLAGFAEGELPFDNRTKTALARLVLVDASEHAWYRARCLGQHHILAAVDPVLVSLTSLQHWLWQRLQAPFPVEDAGRSDSTHPETIEQTTPQPHPLLSGSIRRRTA